MTVNSLKNFGVRGTSYPWFPIETYPKDGSRVLLYFPGFNDPIQIGYRNKDFGPDEPTVWRGSWPDMYFLSNRPQPSHWMWLPKAPNENGGI